MACSAASGVFEDLPHRLARIERAERVLETPSAPCGATTLRSRRANSATDLPSSSMSPLVGASKPTIMRASVDLPAARFPRRCRACGTPHGERDAIDGANRWAGFAQETPATAELAHDVAGDEKGRTRRSALQGRTADLRVRSFPVGRSCRLDPNAAGEMLVAYRRQLDLAAPAARFGEVAARREGANPAAARWRPAAGLRSA